MKRLALFVIVGLSLMAEGQALKFDHQETVRMKVSKNTAAELGSELIIFATIMQRKSWFQWCFTKQLLYEEIKKTEMDFDMRVDRSNRMEFSNPELISPNLPHYEMRKCIQRALNQTPVPEALHREYQIHLVFQSEL